MKHSLLIVLLLSFAFPAKAFFIEPFAGYANGTLDETKTVFLPASTTSDSYDLKGLNYGLRIGFEPGSFQIGAEYLLANLARSGGVVEKDDLSMEEISAFLGYRFWYMRLYTGFILSADDKDSDLTGDGVKAGLSFYASKNLAINLEYRTVELTGIGELGGFLDSNYDVLAFLVSFPFSF